MAAEVPDAHIHLPSPSYWPIVLAFGLPLIGYGLIFNLVALRDRRRSSCSSASTAGRSSRATAPEAPHDDDHDDEPHEPDDAGGDRGRAAERGAASSERRRARGGAR